MNTSHHATRMQNKGVCVDGERFKVIEYVCPTCQNKIQSPAKSGHPIFGHYECTGNGAEFVRTDPS